MLGHLCHDSSCSQACLYNCLILLLVPRHTQIPTSYFQLIQGMLENLSHISYFYRLSGMLKHMPNAFTCSQACLNIHLSFLSRYVYIYMHTYISKCILQIDRQIDILYCYKDKHKHSSHNDKKSIQTDVAIRSKVFNIPCPCSY